MHIDIDNVEGEAGDYKLDLDIHGPLSRRRRDEPDRQTRGASARVGDDADHRGGHRNGELDLKLTGPNSVTQHFALGVTAGAPDFIAASSTRSPPAPARRSRAI
jgi:hypothetical protein